MEDKKGIRLLESAVKHEESELRILQWELLKATVLEKRIDVCGGSSSINAPSASSSFSLGVYPDDLEEPENGSIDFDSSPTVSSGPKFRTLGSSPTISSGTNFEGTSYSPSAESDPVAHHYCPRAATAFHPRHMYSLPYYPPAAKTDSAVYGNSAYRKPVFPSHGAGDDMPSPPSRCSPKSCVSNRRVSGRHRTTAHPPHSTETRMRVKYEERSSPPPRNIVQVMHPLPRPSRLQSSPERVRLSPNRRSRRKSETSSPSSCAPREPPVASRRALREPCAAPRGSRHVAATQEHATSPASRDRTPPSVAVTRKKKPAARPGLPKKGTSRTNGESCSNGSPVAPALARDSPSISREGLEGPQDGLTGSTSSRPLEPHDEMEGAAPSRPAPLETETDHLTNHVASCNRGTSGSSPSQPPSSLPPPSLQSPSLQPPSSQSPSSQPPSSQPPAETLFTSPIRERPEGIFSPSFAPRKGSLRAHTHANSRSGSESTSSKRRKAPITQKHVSGDSGDEKSSAAPTGDQGTASSPRRPSRSPRSLRSPRRRVHPSFASARAELDSADLSDRQSRLSPASHHTAPPDTERRRRRTRSLYRAQREVTAMDVIQGLQELEGFWEWVHRADAEKYPFPRYRAFETEGWLKLHPEARLLLLPCQYMLFDAERGCLDEYVFHVRIEVLHEHVGPEPTLSLYDFDRCNKVLSVGRSEVQQVTFHLAGLSVIVSSASSSGFANASGRRTLHFRTECDLDCRVLYRALMRLLTSETPCTSSSMDYEPEPYNDMMLREPPPVYYWRETYAPPQTEMKLERSLSSSSKKSKWSSAHARLGFLRYLSGNGKSHSQAEESSDAGDDSSVCTTPRSSFRSRSSFRKSFSRSSFSK